MVRDVKSYRTTSLRFQAHLAFTHGLPLIQKCQKSLQARHTPTPGLKDNAAKINNRITKYKNGRLVTRYIKHLAKSANFKGSTFNKLCNGLIVNRFEMPNVSYTHPLAVIQKKP